MINWPSSLIDDIARRKCVIFLGAGISKNSQNDSGIRPKGWKEFLELGVSRIGSSTSKKKCILNCIKKNDYLLACELLKRAMGHDDFIELIKDEFQLPKFKPSTVHEDIFMLDSRIVITPNFDKIYDLYANTASTGTINVKRYSESDIADYIRKNERIILKIHGCISSPNELIFSKLDYARARTNFHNFYLILESLILTHTFIFFGAGINDPDIRLLLEDYAFRYKLTKKHQFIVPKNELSDDEFKIYSDSMNINFIKYDSKSNHKEFVDSLNILVKDVENRRFQIATSQDW